MDPKWSMFSEVDLFDGDSGEGAYMMGVDLKLNGAFEGDRDRFLLISRMADAEGDSRCGL